MSEQWDILTDHERNTLVAEAMGWHEPFIIDPAGESWGHYPTRGYQAVPLFTTDPNVCRLVEDEIARRGLIERYQNALIAILGLDMQVFNSAIELHTFNAPKIPGNDFEWEGHAFLWCYSQATAEQRCHAALRAMGVGV